MLSALFSKQTITLAIVAVILLASCRIMKFAGCNAREPRPPKVINAGPYVVADVPTGASLLVAAGRRGRTRTIFLEGVAAPASGPLAQVSADHLRGMAGDQVTVQYERHGLFRGEAQASLPQQDEAPTATVETPEELEARGPLTGIVFGASGICLNVEQISGGYAMIAAGYDAPKEWRAAEAAAKKAKTGVWR